MSANSSATSSGASGSSNSSSSGRVTSTPTTSKGGGQGTMTAHATGSGGYVPLGNYNDQGASSQSQALINSIKQQYEQAKSQGAPQSYLDSLHQQAESIRSQYGYSGGADGSQGIFLDDPNKYNKQPIAAPTSQSTYVDSLYEAQRRAALAALKSAYDQNVIDVDAQAAKIPQTYQAARNQTAAAAQQGQAAFDERAAAMGLSSGASGQAALSMTNQNTSNQNTINTQQANAVNDLETARLKLSTAYQNDIAQAIAQGDITRAQALYQEAVRVDNGLAQQSMSQADENYRYWATNSNQQLQMAETLAKFGDFSGYLSLGYTPQQVENMRQTWLIANTKTSNYSSYSGGSGNNDTSTSNDENNNSKLFDDNSNTNYVTAQQRDTYNNNNMALQSELDQLAKTTSSGSPITQKIANAVALGQITQAHASMLLKRYNLA